MSTTKRIQIRAKTSRFGYDGQTGVVVLAGTPGLVDTLTLDDVGVSKRIPRLTVYWAVALVQDKSNQEPSTIEDWQESEVVPNEVEYVGLEGE